MITLSKNHRIWILGAGRFGTIAAERLFRKVPPKNILALDHRADRLGGLPDGIETIQMDAVEFLLQYLGYGKDPDWIVPAVPVHVVWEFVRGSEQETAAFQAVSPPPDLLDALPNPLTGEGGAIYTSIADFLCPDNCPEPADRCTHTGKPRPVDLFRAIPEMAGNAWASIVVRSHQLTAGVGGYPPASLVNAVKRVKKARKPVLLATACRCHGVLHLIARS